MKFNELRPNDCLVGISPNTTGRLVLVVGINSKQMIILNSGKDCLGPLPKILKVNDMQLMTNDVEFQWKILRK